MMEKFLEEKLKKMTDFASSKTKFGVNAGVHVTAIIGFSSVAASLDIPWNNPNLGAWVWFGVLSIFTLLMFSFWLCAYYFGPLGK
jgi:hypothetical protein